jgi:Uma2 family endonuclease
VKYFASKLQKTYLVRMSAGLSAPIQPPRPKRFNVEDFYRMAEAGVLGQDHQRTELIEGEILELMPIGPSHAGHVLRVVTLFSQKLGGRYLINSQNPVRLGEYSEPIPDVSVVRCREDFYAGGHPGPEDVVLLVEVADTTLEYDLGRKARLYARAGISEYWIVDLTGHKPACSRAGRRRIPRATIARRGRACTAAAFLNCRSAWTLLGRWK